LQVLNSVDYTSAHPELNEKRLVIQMNNILQNKRKSKNIASLERLTSHEESSPCEPNIQS